LLDIGWSELVVIAVVTVVVLGPQELPRVIRTIRAGLTYIRRMAWDFQQTVDDLVRESDLHTMKDEMTGLRKEMDLRHHAFDSEPTLSWEPGKTVAPVVSLPAVALAEPDEKNVDSDPKA
jgi:sec-independent protein translocase protein TatB